MDIPARHLPSHTRVSCLPFLMFLAGFSCAAATEFTGVVYAPESVDRSTLQAIVLPDKPGEAENDPRPWEPSSITQGGEFTAECTSPTARTLIEFTGKDVRRARFPWPFSVLASPGRRPTFRLESGGWGELVILDDQTKAPLPHVQVGPVVPTEDIGVEERDKTYPFYVRGGADGKALVTGLLPNQPFYANLFAEGYMRKRIQIDPGKTTEVALKRGGLSMSGTLRGEKTGKLYGGEIVLLMGGPEDLYVQRRTDAQGRFSFPGLPGGHYKLLPMIDHLGGARATEYSLFGAKSLEEIWLLVPEGITVSGAVVDLETGLPVADADVYMRSRIFTTDATGQFEFQMVRGPWPIDPLVRQTDYTFSPDDQDRDAYPVNGFEGDDILGLTLKLRRKRFLVVHRDNDPQPERPAILEIHGPLEEKHVPINRERTAAQRSVFPLNSSGTRVFLLRSPSGQVSELLSAHTSLDATTTTIRLTLGIPARLEGSLTHVEGPPPPTFSVLIEANPEGDILRSIDIHSMTPDEQGRFVVDGLPPGVVNVRLVRPGGEPYVEEKLTLLRGETASLHRQVNRGFPLAGRTVDQEGNPLKMIPVSVYGQDPAGAPLHLNTVSDEDGKFRLEGLGGTQVNELRATYHGYAPLVLSNIPLPDENLEVVLSNRQGIEVEVNSPPSSLVFSKVLVLMGRQRSVESAPPQWFYEIESQTPLSGQTEATVFPAAEGRMRLAVDADGQWDVSPALEWTPDSPSRKIVLTPGHTSSLSVRIRGVRDDQIAGLDVSLLNTALPESASALDFQPTSSSGRELLFDSIPAGEYLLLVTSPDGEYAARSNIDVATGWRSEITVDFGGTTTSIEGTVRSGGKNAKPVRGAKVILRFADVAESDPLLEAVTGADGAFRFDKVPAQRPYLVEAQQGGLHRQQQINPDQAVGAARIDLVLQPPVAVTFTVPPSLQSRLASGRMPILIQEINGSRSVTLRPADLQNPVGLEPGTYRVSLGEEPLGTLEIPALGETAEIALPEG